MFRIRLLACALIATIVAVLPASAAQETQLRAVRGTVGYQLAAAAPFTRVVGSLVLTEDRIAITRAESNALLVLADSSAVALGANTNIAVRAITQANAAEPTAMSLVAGTIRFDIRHPAGGRSNYRFQTNTSQIAIRGTIGILATGPDGDTLTCLDCAPDDVTITTKKRKAVVLLTGQTAVISPTGDITVSATAAAITVAFAAAGLSSVAGANSPFIPGIERVRAPANQAAPIAGGVIGAGAIALVATSNSTSAPFTPLPIVAPTPVATPSPSPTPTHSPTPAPSPSGAVTINSHAQQHPQSVPTSAPAAPPAPPAGGPTLPGGRR